MKKKRKRRNLERRVEMKVKVALNNKSASNNDISI